MWWIKLNHWLRKIWCELKLRRNIITNHLPRSVVLQVTDQVIQLDQKRSYLSSLLRILRFEVRISELSCLVANNDCQQRVNDIVANRVILGLVRKLLDLPDYGPILSELEDPSDIDLFLDFFFCVRWRSLDWRFCSLLLAAPRWSPFSVWYSRREPKSQEPDVQTDVQKRSLA